MDFSLISSPICKEKSFGVFLRNRMGILWECGLDSRMKHHYMKMAWTEGWEGRLSIWPGWVFSPPHAKWVCWSSNPSNGEALVVCTPTHGKSACPLVQPISRPALSNLHYHKCLAFLPGNYSSHRPVRIRA